MDDHQIRMMQLAAQGYVCSQILVKMILELRDEEDPLLVRAMAGPGYGCSAGSATCGALVGGCCALALYAGKGSDSETPSERLPLMLTALSEWFADQVGSRHGGITCDKIVGEGGPLKSQQTCAGIVADTFYKINAILAENRIDPTTT
jgi:hypothetical protein